MNYDEILEMMEELIDNSSAVPFSGKKMIDCDQMRTYIDTLRLNMPGEIKQAKELQSQKENILAEANAEAKKIRAQADEYVEETKKKADEMVKETEITRQAKEYAVELISNARKEADEIMAQANADADKTIADAEEKDAQIKRALTDTINNTLAEARAILQRNVDAVTQTMEAFERLNPEPAEEEEAPDFDDD